MTNSIFDIIFDIKKFSVIEKTIKIGFTPAARVK